MQEVAEEFGCGAGDQGVGGEEKVGFDGGEVGGAEDWVAGLGVVGWGGAEVCEREEGFECWEEGWGCGV